MALYKTFMKSVICVNSCPLGNKEFTNQDGLKVCEKNDVTTSQAPATVTESSSMYDTILLSRENKRNSQRKENKANKKNETKKKINSLKIIVTIGVIDQ